MDIEDFQNMLENNEVPTINVKGSKTMTEENIFSNLSKEETKELSKTLNGIEGWREFMETPIPQDKLSDEDFKKWLDEGCQD